MPTKNEIHAEFAVAGWEEDPWEGRDEAPKTHQCRARYRYSGGLEGDSEVRYHMSYLPDGTADFVGIEIFEGSLGERRGILVMRHVGRYDGKESKAQLQILAGRCEGELSGVRGSGELRAGEAPYSLHLRLDQEG